MIICTKRLTQAALLMFALATLAMPPVFAADAAPKAGKQARRNRAARAASAATQAAVTTNDAASQPSNDTPRKGRTAAPAERAYKPSNPQSDRPEWFGAWWRGGDNPQEMKEKFPYIRGVFVGMKWANIEPRKGEFDWAYFDKELTRYARAGFVIQYIIMVGPDSPEWIYDNGVPLVTTSTTISPRGTPHPWKKYPYYLDPDYKTYYHNMIRQVAAHVDTLPADVREKIICIQTAEGTTGDEGPFKGQPHEEQYRFGEHDQRWLDLKFETWLLFKELYEKKQPPIRILINSGNAGQYHDWIMKNMPDTWRKAGNPGHGYQLNNEMDMIAFLDPVINHPNENGNFIRARSEMDETHKGWFKENPLWNQYWLNLWGLHFGLDILQHETQAFAPQHEEGFLLYERYGGRKDPALSPGAFCALRDGLDALDYERFPKEPYGEAYLDPKAADQSAQVARVQNIIKAFASRGAVQGDIDNGNQVVMQNRDASAMNDVGWNIWDSNYQLHMKQIDPNGTSVGWWRVGPTDQPYGRFARGFEQSSGKAAMYFDLDDNFYHGQPDGSRKVMLRVVYLDKGKGSWALHYTGADDAAQVAKTVQTEDSGRWKEVTVEVADAVFSNGGPSNSDLWLTHEGGDDTIFHMIELKRK